MSLYEKMKLVKSTNPYFQKDLKKAQKANKFIGQGSMVSSTDKYRMATGDLGNCGEYENTDIVFISAEGARRGRLDIPQEEILLAINARVTFVTDNEYDRTRPYNVGERQVAALLKEYGYEDKNGVWSPSLNLELKVNKNKP